MTLKELAKKEWDFLEADEKEVIAELEMLLHDDPKLFILLMSRKLMKIESLLKGIAQAVEEGKDYQEWAKLQ